MSRATKQSAMATKVSVGIVTFKRREGLLNLIHGLANQNAHPDRPFDLSIVVIDNDANQTARPVVEAVSTAFESIEIQYVVEPRLGIPIARNRVLESLPLDADAVCFLDDDEIPSENWLDAMLNTWLNSDADCVWGPVRPIFPTGTRKAFVQSGAFDRSRAQLAMLNDGDAIAVASTDNVLLDPKKIRQLGLYFNEDLRFTGGTDLVFFKEAVRRGAKIRWSSLAIVSELVPSSRLNWKYIIKRQYRVGNSYFLSNLLDFPGAVRLSYPGIGLVFMLWGLFELVFTLNMGKRLDGLIRMLNGCGMIGAAAGLVIQEYAPERLSKVALDVDPQRADSVAS